MHNMFIILLHLYLFFVNISKACGTYKRRPSQSHSHCPSCVIPITLAVIIVPITAIRSIRFDSFPAPILYFSIFSFFSIFSYFSFPTSPTARHASVAANTCLTHGQPPPTRRLRRRRPCHPHRTCSASPTSPQQPPIKPRAAAAGPTHNVFPLPYFPVPVRFCVLFLAALLSFFSAGDAVQCVQTRSAAATPVLSYCALHTCVFRRRNRWCDGVGGGSDWYEWQWWRRLGGQTAHAGPRHRPWAVRARWPAVCCTCPDGRRDGR
ncbi:hypothetical protein EDC01DRAFT_176686 [Geopyxis carbonaria]|nr:hypothetical protein EDC01DRAFT_176686 [Geopyxis carbonaria]